MDIVGICDRDTDHMTCLEWTSHPVLDKLEESMLGVTSIIMTGH